MNLDVIPEHVQARVQKRLSEIEREKNVEILHAIESGSRAWGFASTDSDYDVRFIYRHQRDWYLNVLPRRDVIEYAIVDEMDYAGWDLRKALFLMNKSNPVLYEWLRSPILYRSRTDVVTHLQAVARGYFSPKAATYHYLSMARNNYREYLKKERVKVKKYFYVLRPLLACGWIEAERSPPPMIFADLLDALVPPGPLRTAVEELLERKRAGVELGEEPQVPVLNAFIEERIEYFMDVASTYDPREKPSAETLNQALVEILGLEYRGG